jgi:CRP/FNR family transcriptional regulator
VARSRPPTEAEALATVRESGFLLRLPSELRDEVLEEAHLVEYPAGAVAVYRDERLRPALVAWGMVRSYLAWRYDRQLTLVYHRTGDLVEAYRSNGELVGDGIQAIEPSGVLHLARNRFERLAGTRIELAAALSDDLRQQLGHAYQTLARHTFATVRQRIAADLLERAERPLSRKEESVRVTVQELAEAIGSVREVVARTLRQLRMDGVIRTGPGGIVVLDLAELRREAISLS